MFVCLWSRAKNRLFCCSPADFLALADICSFSCLSRTYKYYFVRGNLDLQVRIVPAGTMSICRLTRLACKSSRLPACPGC